MKVRLWLGSVAVLCGALFAGCGGGGDDETTAPAPTTAAATTSLTKEELVAQGNAICAEVNAAVGTVGSTSTGSAGQASQVSDLYGGMAERMQALGAPSDDSAGYEEFIGAAEQLARAQSDAAVAVERGESEAAEGTDTGTSSALSAFQSAARAYGLDRCAEAPSAPTPGKEASGDGAASEESAETGGVGGEVVEAAPEPEEVAPEAGGAAPVEEAPAGGGAAAGGGSAGSGGGSSGGSGSSSGGIGPG